MTWIGSSVAGSSGARRLHLKPAFFRSPEFRCEDRSPCRAQTSPRWSQHCSASGEISDDTGQWIEFIAP